MNELLKRAKAFNTKKALGQNFLVSEEYLNKIVKAIDAKPQEHILEIGPGIGFLTECVALTGALITAIDLDEKAIQSIIQKSNVKILKADALYFDLNSLQKPYKVIGNLPFIIGELNEPHWKVKGIDRMVLMFQEEVAKRLTAKSSSKAYNPLSILMQAKCQTNYLFTVPANCFCPIPKVNAGVIEIKPLAKSPLKELTEQQLKFFRRIIKTAFSTRRKNLKNALQGLIEVEQLQALNISPTLRPENLSLNDYLRLARYSKEAHF
jgi:16S rRNA (adenine1518-N6/adenine1519-N6)-dimethyltransferase